MESVSKLLNRKRALWESLMDMTFKVPILPYDLKTWFHASRIHYLCPIEEAWYAIQQKTRYDAVPFRNKYRMATGTGLHELVLLYMPDLEGMWECWECKYSQTAPMGVCVRCGSENIHYVCRTYKNTKYRIMGTPDGIRRLQDGQREIVEIKTTMGNPEMIVQGEMIKAYLSQVNLYMWLSKIKKARLIVVNQFYPENFHEREVEYDASLVKGLLEKVQTIRKAIKKREVPWDAGTPECPRRDCAVEMCRWRR